MGLRDIVELKTDLQQVKKYILLKLFYHSIPGARDLEDLGRLKKIYNRSRSVFSLYTRSTQFRFGLTQEGKKVIARGSESDVQTAYLTPPQVFFC